MKETYDKWDTVAYDVDPTYFTKGEVFKLIFMQVIRQML